jgi:hypothetical protein
MASFAEIPNNLKDAIVAEARDRDIDSLSKTCKSIRGVALLALIRTITITWNTDFSAPRNPPLALVLRTVLKDASLAALVKTVSFRLQIFP